MSQSSNRTSIFLVFLILTWRIGADVWASIPGHEQGVLVMLLLMEMGVLMIALGLLVKRPRSTQSQFQETPNGRQWQTQSTVDTQVGDALRRSAAKVARLANTARDRGKYGVRRHGSSSAIPEGVPRVNSATPTRGRFAAETHPVAEGGSEPSSS